MVELESKENDGGIQLSHGLVWVLGIASTMIVAIMSVIIVPWGIRVEERLERGTEVAFEMKGDIKEIRALLTNVHALRADFQAHDRDPELHRPALKLLEAELDRTKERIARLEAKLDDSP